MIKKSSIVLIIIAITGWLIYLFPNEAISPGDLLEKHGQLEENCSNCHDTFQGASGEKCAGCHVPDKIGIVQVNKQHIGQEKKSLSFHNKLKPDTCTNCHKEHQGRFTSSRTIQFSHEILGLKNVKNCVECHQRPTNALHQKPVWIVLNAMKQPIGLLPKLTIVPISDLIEITGLNVPNAIPVQITRNILVMLVMNTLLEKFKRSMLRRELGILKIALCVIEVGMKMKRKEYGNL